MPPDSRDAILTEIRQALGRTASSPVKPRPSIPAARMSGKPDEEIEGFIAQVTALSGRAERITSERVPAALASLVLTEGVQKAVVAGTAELVRLGVADQLSRLQVQIIPADASKERVAEADLGITEADFLLPETGTLGLFSSPKQPRVISLLPRVHLAIVRSIALRADLHQVFSQAKTEPYLVFVTGPSRTSDIEMNLTVGVHGPRALYVWLLDNLRKGRIDRAMPPVRANLTGNS